MCRRCPSTGTTARQLLDARLETVQLFRVDSFEIEHAVLATLALQRFELAGLRVVDCDDDFAATLVVDRSRFAIRVELYLACDTEACLERARRVVHARVDDLGVSRGDLLADARMSLEHEHLAAGERECARNGEPDDAGADDDAFDGFAHGHGFDSSGPRPRCQGEVARAAR